MKRTRRNHGASFKAEVALAAVKGGYHLHSHAPRLRVSLRRPGLGESPSVGGAALQYADHGLLSRRGAGGDYAVWPHSLPLRRS
jgi:hypothetical protein